MVEKRKLTPVQVKRGAYQLGSLKTPASSIAKKASSTPDRRHGISPASNFTPYKGVRMRVWGKWVTEVRDPNTKTRIWLGSFATAEMAARAYDAAVMCLKGPSAPELNFPDSVPPFYPQSTSPKDIQAVALAAATASVPAAAPLAIKTTYVLDEEIMDSASLANDAFVQNSTPKNTVLPEPKSWSNHAAVEEWINKEFGEPEPLDQESTVFQELLKRADDAEMVDSVAHQLNKEPAVFEWPPFDDADGTIIHEMELWSFT